jgi:hypothetical protein
MRRRDRSTPTPTANRDGKTERRPHIKGVRPAHHQLDLPLPHETEQRVVEHVRTIAARRGECRAFAHVGCQRTQTQLDLRGVSYRSAPTVGEGHDDAVGPDPARRNGERNVDTFDRILKGERPLGRTPLL